MGTRGLVIALALMLVLLLAAGSAQSQPSLAPSDHDNYFSVRGVKECNPLCFVKCAFGGGDLLCYGKCLLLCFLPPTGEADGNEPQYASCMANCAVPACAKLSTKADPLSKEVDLCLQSCGDNCAAMKTGKQQHQLNHSP